MRTSLIKYLRVVMLPIITFASCEKIEVDQKFTTFGEVYFDANNTVIGTTGHLKVKYNTQPIDMGVDGRIRVPEGEGIFAFYDERTGEVLGEKTVNIVSGGAEKFNLFQPSDKDPIAFLDPNGQANEEAAPDGFMKIKIANYAGDFIPVDLDVVVLGLNMNLETVELATLEDVSNNLGEEEYRLVPTGGADILAYTFKFRDRNTQAFVQNHGGVDCWNQNIFLYPDIISPFPEKRVYTIYLKPYEQWGEYVAFIKYGDKFYEINPEILYAN